MNATGNTSTTELIMRTRTRHGASLRNFLQLGNACSVQRTTTSIFTRLTDPSQRLGRCPFPSHRAGRLPEWLRSASNCQRLLCQLHHHFQQLEHQIQQYLLPSNSTAMDLDLRFRWSLAHQAQSLWDLLAPSSRCLSHLLRSIPGNLAPGGPRQQFARDFQSQHPQ